MEEDEDFDDYVHPLDQSTDRIEYYEVRQFVLRAMLAT